MINIKLVFPSLKGCCHDSHFVGFIPEVDVAGHRQLVAQPGRGCNVGLCRASSYWQFAFSFYAWLC